MYKYVLCGGVGWRCVLGIITKTALLFMPSETTIIYSTYQIYSLHFFFQRISTITPWESGGASSFSCLVYRDAENKQWSRFSTPICTCDAGTTIWIRITEVMSLQRLQQQRASSFLIICRHDGYLAPKLNPLHVANFYSSSWRTEKGWIFGSLHLDHSRPTGLSGVIWC